MLLDVVLLYNTVVSLSHREQTVKLNQEGFEVSTTSKCISAYLFRFILILRFSYFCCSVMEDLQYSLNIARSLESIIPGRRKMP